jgi:hypothetical protein
VVTLGIITCIFASNGSHYFEDGLILMHSPWIMQVAWREIVDAPFTHCWHSIDLHSQDIVAMLSQSLLPQKVANSSIMVLYCHTTLGLFWMQGQTLFKLHWHSLLEWGNKSVAWHCTYNAEQCTYFATMWQCSPLIAESVRLTTVDASLTYTLNTSKQSSHSQSFFATNRVVIIDKKQRVSMRYH